MNIVELYCKARLSIEDKFRGLPYAHIVLVNYLIARANPVNGTVSRINYNDIALLLTIHKAPGRKESGIPTKQTVRNYIKTIERQCGDHFKVISEGQTLKFLFPSLPRIFSKFFNNPDDDTESKFSESLIGSENLGHFNLQANREVNTEPNTDSNAVKNIYILNKTNNNKLTNTVNMRFCSSKNHIDDDFYPSPATIEKALSMGLGKVIDQDEINAFIEHNKNNFTRWADFNPVFLTWLERDAEYTKNKQQRSEKTVRSQRNEQGSNQNSQYPELLRQVSELHGIPIESVWGSPISESSPSRVIDGSFIPPLDTTHWNIRSTFYE